MNVNDDELMNEACGKRQFHKKYRENGDFKSLEDLRLWYKDQFKEQNGKCFYCKTSFFDIKRLIDDKKLNGRLIGHGGYRGKYPEIECLENEKRYLKGNCVLACYYCNNDKSNVFSAKEYKEYFGLNRNQFFEKLLRGC